MESDTGYYNVEIDMSELLSGSSLDDVFYLQDLKQRKLFLNTDITQASVEFIVKHILQFNREDAGVDPDKREPIRLYLNSDGGDEIAGLSLIDSIVHSNTPVWTINLSKQYSMGFFIGIAGHKRYAMPSSTFLLHDGTNFIYNSGSKAKDSMEFSSKLDERLREYVLSRTKIDRDTYDENIRREWFMFADEAKRLGVTDYIVGEDCGMEMIV